MKQLFAWCVIVIGFGCLIARFWLIEYWSAILPTSPDQSIGAIVQYNNHGHLFYMTQWQSAILILGWVGTFAGMGGGAFWLGKILGIPIGPTWGPRPKP